MKGSATSFTKTTPGAADDPSSRSVDRFRLTGPTRPRDARITAARRDIADVALAGVLFAPHYARAMPFRCGDAAVAVRGEPSATATATSQILPGEDFSVLDIGGDWAWGYCDADGYVGYVPCHALMARGPATTHAATAAAAPVFGAADIKAPVARILPIGSRLAGVAGDDFLVLHDGGFVHRRHVTPAGDISSDPVATACGLVGMPYVWGARGGGGIDCSGLVQLCLSLAGIAAPRDSDQQRDTVGRALADDEDLRRGDIVFFPGHVGMMVDPAMMVHANAHWMAVTIEPLADVVARIAATHAHPILSRRRLP